MSYPKSTSCGEIGLILHDILNLIIPFKIDGTFIEIGANDGKTGSFTFNLAHIGWNGINIEPIPRLHAMCTENHKMNKMVKNICCAIGEKEDVLNIIDADTLSTMDKETLDVYIQTDWAKGNFANNTTPIQTRVRKLDDVLFENNIIDIDIMVLDVEGFEENVLKGLSINTYRPKIFIIEIPDQHPDMIKNSVCVEKYKRLRSYFVANEYDLIVNDIVDNVYVARSILVSSDVKKKLQSRVRFPQKDTSVWNRFAHGSTDRFSIM